MVVLVEHSRLKYGGGAESFILDCIAQAVFLGKMELYCCLVKGDY
ncbi:MAG: hypothetical protein PWP64_59 [Candidatus Cloacimonadota bacterium]|nr:hypothetical protein [Candidatus Cloacimonadota bacterium]